MKKPPCFLYMLCTMRYVSMTVLRLLLLTMQLNVSQTHNTPGSLLAGKRTASRARTSRARVAATRPSRRRSSASSSVSRPPARCRPRRKCSTSATTRSSSSRPSARCSVNRFARRWSDPSTSTPSQSRRGPTAAVAAVRKLVRAAHPHRRRSTLSHRRS